jgi:hypothetical protein
VQVDLDRIPLERCTVDDVYTQDRWRVVEFAGWRFVGVDVVALTNWIVARLCVRKAPARTAKQQSRVCKIEIRMRVGPLEQTNGSRILRKTSTYL